MSLTITEGTTIPEVSVGRTREPNPFDGKFPTKGHGTDKQKTLIVELPSRTEEEKKYVEKVKNQAQTAARESKSEQYPNGFTARVHAEPCKVEVTDDKGKKHQVDGTRLTIWSIDRIFREGAGRKKDGEQETPQETSQS